MDSEISGDVARRVEEAATVLEEAGAEVAWPSKDDDAEGEQEVNVLVAVRYYGRKSEARKRVQRVADVLHTSMGGTAKVHYGSELVEPGR